MLRFVARQNIVNFERLLVTASDPAKRAMLNGLIVSEREALHALPGAHLGRSTRARDR